jgi:hypothetical protein
LFSSHDTKIALAIVQKRRVSAKRHFSSANSFCKRIPCFAEKEVLFADWDFNTAEKMESLKKLSV